MKKIVMAMFVLVAFVGSAFAADVIEMKKGVKFNHKAHQTAAGNCKKCHEKAEGGKIAGFGKEFAHKQCKECHAEKKVGQDAKCKFCHK
jgi:cytochrome c553